MPLKSPIQDLEVPDVSLPEFIFGYLKKYGESVAIIDNRSKQSLTYQDLYTQAIKLAGFLHEQGLKKGDVVGVCAPSCIEYASILFGTMACGAALDLSNPAFKENEIVHQYQHSKPVMLFVAENLVGKLENVTRDIPSIRNIFVIGKSQKCVNFNSIVSNEDNLKHYQQKIDINAAEDVALITHSSGTTGLPKGVLVTHRNLVASALAFGKLTQYSRDDICYSDRPMFSSGGFIFIIYGLPIGLTVVYEQDFETVCLPKEIQSNKISVLIGVPQAILALAHNVDHKKYDTSSLREIRCGGATIPSHLLRTVSEKYKTNIALHYGSTEAAEISSNSEIYRYEGAVGVLFPNTEVKIVDIVTNEEMSDDNCGEILVKGDQVFKGYLANPEVTKKAIQADGWFHTGDLGYIREERLYVVDRLKEIIKYKAVQVAPAEIEGVLFKHSMVSDAGVIGIPDNYAGELPKAFIVKNDERLSEKDIIEFVKEELADYKQLRGGVQFVKKIPRSILGKIQRNKLKEMHVLNAEV